jgi:NAD(P)-dependent dehydrogenase (short-subunit alcohol dehydrogenase family)
MAAINLSTASLFDINGKVALVTGGGTGIGKMIASALVQNGCKVYIASRKLQVVQDTANELNSLPARGKGICIALQADLGSKENAYELARKIMEKESKLHLLFNNAGMSWGATLTGFPETNGWDRLFALNVKTCFYLSVALLPALEAASRGNRDPSRIINISSIAAITPMAETPLAQPGSGTWSYNASKAALNHLTRSLAISFAEKYITVNAIAPGFFPSKMTSFGLEKNMDVLNAVQPLGRIGSTEDIAGLALFLSSKARYFYIYVGRTNTLYLCTYLVLI